MLTKEQVQHLAKLARLELSGADISKFQKQLSAILDYVAQLQEVDTKGVEPTAQVTGLENIARLDVADNALADSARAGILENMPSKKGEFVKVKAVFE